MVMLDSHVLTPFSETNHIKYLSHDIPLNNFTYDPYSSVNFFQSHCIYYDKIKVWLEKSFHERFLVNSHPLNFFQSHCIYYDKIKVWLEKSFHERFLVNSHPLIVYMLDLDLYISNFSFFWFIIDHVSF
jgi:hypothetical protein